MYSDRRLRAATNSLIMLMSMVTCETNVHLACLACALSRGKHSSFWVKRNLPAKGKGGGRLIFNEIQDDTIVHIPDEND